MGLSEEEKAKLDAAAEAAKKQLDEIAKKFPDACVALGRWFDENKGSAGYKRLARLVTDLAKE
jgi:hypothetical protein